MAIETLDARLSRVIYHKPSRFSRAGAMFLIGRADNGCTVKGAMEHPIEGENYRFYGEWKDQKERNETAFEFHSFEVMIDQSSDGVADYLERYVKGLGRVKSRAIVEHFGVDTLAILETTPDRATEVAGVTEKLVDAMKAHFADKSKVDPVAFASLADIFRGHRVPKTVVTGLIDDWGASAAEVVREKPYSILLDYPRMGWKTVDAIALTTLQYDPKGIDRQKAAVLESLTVMSTNEGHTFGHAIEVEAILFTLISMRPDPIAWDSLASEGKIVVRETPAGREVALAKLDAAERSIARSIDRLTRTAREYDFTLPTDGLNEDQRHAVEMIESNGVCVLAGSPGTGKSYTVASVIAGLRASDVSLVQVVAPTGKAAKRAAELIAKALPGVLIPCSTIHRALTPKPSDDDAGTPASSSKFGRGRDEFGFGHNEGNPLECEWLFIDECSMVDCRLMASLLEAVASGTRVVFIGDPNQLPSVGPGSVLRDMIAAGVPCVTLDKIVRSDGGGRIVRACHAIKDGRSPEPAERIALDTENWVHIEADTPADIADQIVELHRPTKRFPDPVWDCQLVTPQKSTPMGTAAMNARLVDRLNPRPPRGPNDSPEGGPEFCPGDKVIRTKNDKAELLTAAPPGTKVNIGDKKMFTFDGQPYRVTATTVVNGDLGTVLGIVEEAKISFIVVRFTLPDRVCRLPLGDHNLMLAYALTCHKAQGSGFPFVIVPVHGSFYYDTRNDRGLWTREWLYTAISRAETLLITVGQRSAIDLAIGRKTVQKRNTRLIERLYEAMPQLAVETSF